MAATTNVSIAGMTCAHCVASVTGELAALPQVSDVQVDLESGTATITSDEPLDLDAVRAAVEEAGYELTS